MSKTLTKSSTDALIDTTAQSVQAISLDQVGKQVGKKLKDFVVSGKSYDVTIEPVPIVMNGYGFEKIGDPVVKSYSYDEIADMIRYGKKVGLNPDDHFYNGEDKVNRVQFDPVDTKTYTVYEIKKCIDFAKSNPDFEDLMKDYPSFESENKLPGNEKGSTEDNKDNVPMTPQNIAKAMKLIMDHQDASNEEIRKMLDEAGYDWTKEQAAEYAQLHGKDESMGIDEGLMSGDLATAVDIVASCNESDEECMKMRSYFYDDAPVIKKENPSIIKYKGNLWDQMQMPFKQDEEAKPEVKSKTPCVGEWLRQAEKQGYIDLNPDFDISEQPISSFIPDPLRPGSFKPDTFKPNPGLTPKDGRIVMESFAGHDINEDLNTHSQKISFLEAGEDENQDAVSQNFIPE